MQAQGPAAPRGPATLQRFFCPGNLVDAALGPPWHRSPALLSTSHHAWAVGHFHSSLNGHCHRLHVPTQQDSCSQEPGLSEEEAARSSGSCSVAWAVMHAAASCGQVKQAFAFCILASTRNHAGAFLGEPQANPGSEEPGQDCAWQELTGSGQSHHPKGKLPSPVGWWVRAGLVSMTTVRARISPLC